MSQASLDTFPGEIVEEILKFAAASSLKTCLALCLVSSSTRRIALPYLPIKKNPEVIKLIEWRRKAQNTFLDRRLPSGEPGEVISEREMHEMDKLFVEMENYEKINLNSEYLTFSKLHKVLMHISNLSLKKVPQDAQFNLRLRARTLLNDWQAYIKKPKKSAVNATPYNV